MKPFIYNYLRHELYITTRGDVTMLLPCNVRVWMLLCRYAAVSAERRSSAVTADRGYSDRRAPPAKDVMGRPDERYTRYVTMTNSNSHLH